MRIFIKLRRHISRKVDEKPDQLIDENGIRWEDQLAPIWATIGTDLPVKGNSFEQPGFMCIEGPENLSNYLQVSGMMKDLVLEVESLVVEGPSSLSDSEAEQVHKELDRLRGEAPIESGSRDSYDWRR